jgi:hypothetical protein
VAILGACATPARADGSLFDSLGKSMGLVAEPANPPDFVKASRPKAEPSAIPVFATPEEPRSTIKSPAQLKAMDADLQGASRRQSVGGGAADKQTTKPRRAKAPAKTP